MALEASRWRRKLSVRRAHMSRNSHPGAHAHTKNVRERARKLEVSYIVTMAHVSLDARVGQGAA